MNIEIELDLDDLEKTAYGILDSLPIGGDIEYYKYYVTYNNNSSHWIKTTNKIRQVSKGQYSNVSNGKYGKYLKQASGVLREMEDRHKAYDNLDQSDFINLTDEEYEYFDIKCKVEELFAYSLFLIIGKIVSMDENEVNSNLEGCALSLFKGYVIISQSNLSCEDLVKRVQFIYAKVLNKRYMRNSIVKDFFISQKWLLKKAIRKFPKMLPKNDVCKFLKFYLGKDKEEFWLLSVEQIVKMLNNINPAPRFRNGKKRVKIVLDILENRLDNELTQSIAIHELTEILVEMGFLNNTHQQSKNIVTNCIRELRVNCGCVISGDPYRLDNSISYDRSPLD